MTASKKKKPKTSITYFSSEQKKYALILVSAEFVSYIYTILSKQNILFFRRRILPRKKYLQKDFQVRYRKLKQAKGSSTYYLILINNSD